MTTIERTEEAVAQDTEVTIVDTDVHPLPVSGEVLKSYAPPEWKDKLWSTGNAVSPMSYFYDTPDAYKTSSLRVDSTPPRGGAAGSDPDFAAKQLLIDAGVSIALLEPMAADEALPHVVAERLREVDVVDTEVACARVELPHLEVGVGQFDEGMMLAHGHRLGRRHDVADAPADLAGPLAAAPATFGKAFVFGR